MAYFSNSSGGAAFYAECGSCKYGQEPCPIALVQYEYNYDALNNETATKILDTLVDDDGTCAMKRAFIKDFKTDAHNLKIDFDQPI